MRLIYPPYFSKLIKHYTITETTGDGVVFDKFGEVGRVDQSHLVVVVVVSEQLKVLSGLLLVLEDEGQFLLEVPHEEVVVHLVFHWKLLIRDDQTDIAHIVEKGFGGGGHPQQSGYVLVDEDSHFFDPALPPDLHGSSEEELVEEVGGWAFVDWLEEFDDEFVVEVLFVSAA